MAPSNYRFFPSRWIPGLSYAANHRSTIVITLFLLRILLIIRVLPAVFVKLANLPLDTVLPSNYTPSPERNIGTLIRGCEAELLPWVHRCFLLF